MATVPALRGCDWVVGFAPRGRLTAEPLGAMQILPFKGGWACPSGRVDGEALRSQTDPTLLLKLPSGSSERQSMSSGLRAGSTSWTQRRTLALPGLAALSCGRLRPSSEGHGLLLGATFGRSSGRPGPLFGDVHSVCRKNRAGSQPPSGGEVPDSETGYKPSSGGACLTLKRRVRLRASRKL